jgi:hypothetical protein
MRRLREVICGARAQRFDEWTSSLCKGRAECRILVAMELHRSIAGCAAMRQASAKATLTRTATFVTNGDKAAIQSAFSSRSMQRG